MLDLMAIQAKSFVSRSDDFDPEKMFQLVVEMFTSVMISNKCRLVFQVRDFDDELLRGEN